MYELMNAYMYVFVYWMCVLDMCALDLDWKLGLLPLAVWYQEVVIDGVRIFFFFKHE